MRAQFHILHKYTDGPSTIAFAISVLVVENTSAERIFSYLLRPVHHALAVTI